MSNESMNYVRGLIRKAYYSGAWDMARASVLKGGLPHRLMQQLLKAMEAEAARHAEETAIDENALRCWNSGRHQGEGESSNLRPVPTTPGASAQLPPLAADLEGLAVSLGVLAGNVSSEQWEFLKIFRANLRSAAERVAALENSLEVPHEQA